MLAEIRAAKVKIGLASVSLNAPGILHALGIHQAFDFCADASRIRHSKPDPEIYNLVLKKWNFTPQQVVAFEDSPTGVRAAKNAGIYCAAIPNPITAKMDISHADVIFNSFTEVDLHEIMRNLEN